MRFIKNTLAFSLLTTSTLICRAADVVEPLKPVRIITKAPVDVRHLTPRGAKTLQLTVFKIGDNHSDVLLHLYDDSKNRTSSAHLDLFMWRSGHFARVQSLKLLRPTHYPFPTPPVGRYTEDWSPDPLQIHSVQWLDIKKQNQPIIAVRVPNYIEDTGFESEGEIRLFIFVNGVQQKPTQQAFYYLNGWGGSQLLSFSAMNKQGKVRLSDDYEWSQGGPDYVESRSTIYEWTGKQFTLVK